MLTKLLPEQISKLWPIIKYAIEQSVPPATGEHPEKMNRILSSALCGKIDIWAAYTKGETNKFEAIVVTELLYDEPSGIKNLLLYSLYGYDKVSKSSWIDGLVTLAKYGKSLRCTNLVAYSSEQDIIELVKRLGGDTSFTFLSFRIDEIVKKLNDLGGN